MPKLSHMATCLLPAACSRCTTTALLACVLSCVPETVVPVDACTGEQLVRNNFTWAQTANVVFLGARCHMAPSHEIAALCHSSRHRSLSSWALFCVTDACLFAFGSTRCAQRALRSPASRHQTTKATGTLRPLSIISMCRSPLSEFSSMAHAFSKPQATAFLLPPCALCCFHRDTNDQRVTSDHVAFLQQLVKRHTFLRSADLYLAGESYAGVGDAGWSPRGEGGMLLNDSLFRR